MVNKKPKTVPVPDDDDPILTCMVMAANLVLGGRKGHEHEHWYKRGDTVDLYRSVIKTLSWKAVKVIDPVEEWDVPPPNPENVPPREAHAWREVTKDSVTEQATNFDSPAEVPAKAEAPAPKPAKKRARKSGKPKTGK